MSVEDLVISFAKFDKVPRFTATRLPPTRLVLAFLMEGFHPHRVRREHNQGRSADEFRLGRT